MSPRSDSWSRRRDAVAQEEAQHQATLENAALQQDQAELETLSEAEILAKLDLPDPDTLQPGDDFSAFMKKAVPEVIRRRALRTLWRSNPVLANVDMLVDYGEDFTDSALAVENIQTAYQVGKGMLKHVEEMARQAAEADVADVAEEASEEPEKVGLTEIAEADHETPPEDPVSDPAPDMTPSPRRMTFHIEETA